MIGGGNMGGALIEGFLKSGSFTAQDIQVADPSEATRSRYEAMGLTAFANNREAVSDADVVIIAVKPWYATEVAREICSTLKDGACIVSVAAGIPLKGLEDLFGTEVPVFRCIPNIGAASGSSMSFISSNTATQEEKQQITELFDTVGTAAVIPESQLDAAMVLASCGTAYALRYLRAAMQAGIQMGLTANLSRTAVAQTLKGAAELLLDGEIHPEAAVDQVTTPGGVTIVGLNAMEQKGFTTAVLEGHLAAYRKVKEK
ncbi:MAG: pyrroline-5-carboxylate reductase [Rikenellaceae bacterium]|nr:pyrroline-5-carboxylate reductase [Rikenellaceae bacterium]